MPKIKDIIESAKLESFYYYCNCQETIDEFLKSSLTSLLDSLEKELPKEIPQETIDEETYCIALRHQGANHYRQEVINIINSHR